MTTTVSDIVSEWRAAGPVKWAESAFGWICEDGKPVTLTPWQRAALEAWWKNRETCSTFAISNIKKTGKTFLNSVLLAWRWLALPGQHFAVGNDMDQAESRSFAMIGEMVRRNPYLKSNVITRKNELVFTPTGSQLTTLAVDAAGNAGANHLTASHTEAWGIFYESGIRAFEELTPPPGLFYGLPALRVCDSYAGYEGESATWHGIVDRGLTGGRISEDWPIYQVGGLVMFHMVGQEARERCYRGDPEEAAAYYAEQKASLRPNAFTRMHENERTAGEGAYVTPEQWAACYAPDLKPLAPGEVIKMVFGLDASTSRDYTALVGTICNPISQTIDLKYVKIWKPVKIKGIRFGKPTVDLALVDREVLRLHRAGLVAKVVLDPYQLHSSLLTYTRAGIQVVELAQNAGRVEADQSLYDSINSGAIRHYNDPEMNQAVNSASGIDTPRGVRIAKMAAGRHIDALVALSMANSTALKMANLTLSIPFPFATITNYLRGPVGPDWPPGGPDVAVRHNYYIKGS
jgi:hypothetical protein